jgi:hypothetical protein
MKNALALGFGHVLFNAGLASGAAAWAVSGGPGERSAQAATAATMTEGADRDGSPALRIGDARVVEAQVDPKVPVQVKTEGRTVAVVFARPRGDHELVCIWTRPRSFPCLPTSEWLLNRRGRPRRGRCGLCWTTIASSCAGGEATPSMATG